MPGCAVLPRLIMRLITLPTCCCTSVHSPNRFVFYRALFLVVPVLDHFNQHMHLLLRQPPSLSCCQHPVQLVTDGMLGAVAVWDSVLAFLAWSGVVSLTESAL